ncbi:yvaG [Symbiodinium natans]|uniref:YvaG protein n=1 Tax=Symbiodinium natans TaxID=878477 RepID=A0A812U336_9DINO|nr:yvaG [Symbiodinium natans]
MSYTGLHSTPSAEQDQHSEIEGSAGSEDDGFIPVTDSTSHYRGVRLRLPLLLLCCLASLVVYVSRFTAFGKMENGVDRRSEVISLSESLQSAKALVFNAINAASKRGPHELRELDPLPTILAVKKSQKMRSANIVTCSFDAVEAFFSAMGLGDDINGMVRVCPDPRPYRSEVACQVDSGMLIFWAGNLASKLASAVSNCEDSVSVGGGWVGGVAGNKGGPLCAAGIGQLTGALGELAAAASMAAATCGPNATEVDEDIDGRVSTFGDQTYNDYFLSRKLLIGEGEIGNDIQCAVDVGMVASNIAHMGLAINSAVNSGSCQHLSLPLREALCTVDIGNAVAYFLQVVTFIQFSIVNCEDIMNVSALCGASIAGIGTAAASIAPAAAAIHRGCNPGIVPPLPKTSTSSTLSSTVTSTTSLSSTVTSTSSLTSTVTSTTTVTSETTATETSTTFTQQSFDCLDLGFAPLQLINRAGAGSCPDGSDIKQLDVSTGQYNILCTIPDKCFNACGMKPGSNFIYCIEKDALSNNQLVRIDCPAGGTGTACFLGKLERSFSAGFNPVTGEYIETDQTHIRTVTVDVDTLTCSQTPVASNIPYTQQNLINPSGSTLADILISDIPNPPAGATGQWLLSCSQSGQVYIQNLLDSTFHYTLTMQAIPGSVVPGGGSASGAQWQWQTSLYCAYNDGRGVWQVFEDTIDFGNLTIDVEKAGMSQPTSSNDGLNCLGGESPFTTTTP